MATLERLVAALNAHDLHDLVSCFARDYVNETPAHPQRSFRGNEQVRRNWTQIFAGVPDISARLPRTAVDGDTVWTEWELSGTRTDGAAFLMRGVVIFGVEGATITSARFYLEPVEAASGDVNAHTRRVAGGIVRSEDPQLGASPDHPMPLLRAKGEAEQRLRDSGMAWTVLQPNMFLDKLPMAVVGGPALAGEPVTLVGDGRRLHSLVAMRDVAAYAVAALEHRQAKGKTLVIGGPQPVSWRDIIAAFAQELGRDVPVRTVPFGQAVPGMPDFVPGLLSALETYDSPMDSSMLAAAYDVTPTSLADFVRGWIAGSRQRVD